MTTTRFLKYFWPFLPLYMNGFNLNFGRILESIEIKEGIGAKLKDNRYDP